MSLLSGLVPGVFLTRIALGALLQATAVILVAALVAATTLRRRAAARHNLWLAALLWVFLSPAVAVVADRLSVPLRVVILPDPHSRSASGDASPFGQSATLAGLNSMRDGLPAEPLRSRSERSPGSRRAAPGPSVSAQVARPAVGVVPGTPPSSSAAAHSRNVQLAGSVIALWGVGLLIGLGRIAVGWRRVSVLMRSTRPLDVGRYRSTLESVRDVLGVVALPPVMTSDLATEPVALGLFRPRIVLPEGLAEAITCHELRDVLVHEGAHALRNDLWVGLAQRLAGTLFWPYPLVHYLNGQLSRAREEVCDNHVLRCDDACGYARALLTITQQCRPFPEPRSGLGMLGARWTLTDRVAGLLDPGRVPLTRTTRRAKAALTCALAATGLTAASIQFAPPQRAEGQERLPARGALAGQGTIEEEVWRVQGIVVDQRGRPVAGAVVRPPSSADQAGVHGGVTAGDGTFALAFSGRHRSVYGLVAQEVGRRRVGLGRDGTPYSFRTRDFIRITLKPPRTLTVRVKDPTGAPIAGADVEAVEYGYQTQGRTGPDGSATLRVAADARILWVIAQKTGTGFDYFENLPDAVSNEPAPLPPELVLTLDGALPLRIRAVDSEGRPLPGVRVSPQGVRRSPRRNPVNAAFASTSWITTDDSGLAILDRLPQDVGGCGFAVRSASYFSASPLVSERDGPTELTVRLLKPARLSGKVELAGGRPARNCIVRAEGSLPSDLGSVGLARTGDDGTFAMEVLPERAYVVTVEDESWAAPSRTGIVVREGQTRGGIDFRLSEGTLLHGRIAEGARRKPSAGKVVVLIEEGPLLPKEFRLGVRNSRLSRATTTDAEGRYSFRIGPGSYTLRVGSETPSKLEIANEPELVRDVIVPTSTTAMPLDALVVEKTPVGDRPVSRASVTVWTAQGGRTNPMTTDDRGRLRIAIPSPIFLYARDADGRLSGLTHVPERAATVKVVVSPAARIAGRVVDTDGRPLAKRRVSVRLEFAQDGARRHGYDAIARTDGQGRFQYSGVPAGTWGEVSTPHEPESRGKGPRTVVPFRVDEPEEVEIPYVVVPLLRPKRAAAPRSESVSRPPASPRARPIGQVPAREPPRIAHGGRPLAASRRDGLFPPAGRHRPTTTG